ncbi:hypothetical protein PHBOTO_003609 [Pseudozyma hubeiensis]|nr:hypothetical protein PHBOTO_003609 [Pseudozyma hubeiensis]
MSRIAAACCEFVGAFPKIWFTKPVHDTAASLQDLPACVSTGSTANPASFGSLFGSAGKRRSLSLTRPHSRRGLVYCCLASTSGNDFENRASSDRGASLAV